MSLNQELSDFTTPGFTESLIQILAEEGKYPKPPDCENGPYAKDKLCELLDIDHKTLSRWLKMHEKPFPGNARNLDVKLDS